MEKQQELEDRFESYSPITKLFVYTIALREERYELLAVLNKLVDDEFRSQVPTINMIIDHVEPKLLLVR